MGPYLNNSLNSGAQVKNSFQPLLFFFLLFFYLRNNCLTFLIPLLFSLSWDLQIFKSPVLLKKCKGAAHHNNSSVNTQKRAYLTLCLLPPSERYIFSFLLKKRNKKKKKRCFAGTFHMFGRGTKAGHRWGGLTGHQQQRPGLECFNLAVRGVSEAPGPDGQNCVS